MNKEPKFKLNSSGLSKDKIVSNFRVRNEVHKKLVELSNKADIPMGDVVRQMIDFAIEHMDPQ